jgi:hypothetical protein
MDVHSQRLIVTGVALLLLYPVGTALRSFVQSQHQPIARRLIWRRFYVALIVVALFSGAMSVAACFLLGLAFVWALPLAGLITGGAAALSLSRRKYWNMGTFYDRVEK